MVDLYEKVRRKLHLPSRQEAKNFVFRLLYGPESSQPKWFRKLVSDHYHDKLVRDYGGEGG